MWSNLALCLFLSYWRNFHSLICLQYPLINHCINSLRGISVSPNSWHVCIKISNLEKPLIKKCTSKHIRLDSLLDHCSFQLLPIIPLAQCTITANQCNFIDHLTGMLNVHLDTVTVHENIKRSTMGSKSSIKKLYIGKTKQFWVKMK